MKNIQYLHQLINPLTEKEFTTLKKSFKKYQGNKPNRITALLEIVKRFDKNLDEDIKDLIETLLKSSFTKDVNDEKQLRNWVGTILHDVKLFIIQLQAKEDTRLRLDALRSYASVRGLPRIHSDIIGKQEKLLSNQKLHLGYASDDFFLTYRLYFNPRNDANAPKKGAELFNNCANALDIFIATSKLLVACEAYCRNITAGEQNEILYLEEVERQAVKLSNDYPTIRVYHHILKLYKGDTKMDVTTFEQYYLDHKGFFEAEERLTVLVHLTNLTGIYFNQTSDRAALQVLHQLNLARISKDILDQTMGIRQKLFIQIVQVGLYVGKVDWSFAFIKSYNNYLDVKFRADTVAFCEGICHRHLKNWDDAIDSIGAVSRKHGTIYLQALQYQVMCLFESRFLEKNERDASMKLCDTILLTLKSNSYKDNQFSLLAGNFAKLTKRLMHYHVNYQELKEEINETKELGAKKWLLEQCDVLIIRQNKKY